MRTVEAASRGCATVVAAALLIACSDGTPSPPRANDATGTPAAAASALADRGWVGISPGAPVGTMLIFLSDGTLVQDSCWETYRLSRWRTDGANALRWQEDAAEIRASIVKLTESELTLLLELTDGPLRRDYVAASVPYVCPDMPR